jgi:hypothetical protein
VLLDLSLVDTALLLCTSSSELSVETRQKHLVRGHSLQNLGLFSSESFKVFFLSNFALRIKCFAFHLKEYTSISCLFLTQSLL